MAVDKDGNVVGAGDLKAQTQQVGVQALAREDFLIEIEAFAVVP